MGMAMLLACQIAGDHVASWLEWPLPGPVWGMAFLTLVLALVRGIPRGLEQVSQWLLKAMPLFFIPAGVGVILLSEPLRSAWLPISAALVGSTFIALATTALVMNSLEKILSRGKRAP